MAYEHKRRGCTCAVQAGRRGTHLPYAYVYVYVYAMSTSSLSTMPRFAITARACDFGLGQRRVTLLPYRAPHVTLKHPEGRASNRPSLRAQSGGKKAKEM